MPGFLGYYGNSEMAVPDPWPSELLLRSAVGPDYLFRVRTIRKFERDRVCSDLPDYVVITEGVIFNAGELERQMQVTSVDELCVAMYERYGETFFSKFRGSFSGVFYDKRSKVLLVYTDHIGDKTVFYSGLSGNRYVFASEIKYIVEFFRTNKIAYTLDIAGSYSLLTYSHMLGNLTSITGVCRLNAGHYLRISNTEMDVKQYHSFQYLPNYQMSETETIENLDNLFTIAVSRQLEKDREYGYKHLAALSGGLDSRMTTFAINRILGEPITNFTYSPVGFHDERISKQIVKDLRNNYIYQANDNGELLGLIDEAVGVNEGLWDYYGPAALLWYFSNIDLERFGLVHTGQIGDGIVGSITKNLKDATTIEPEIDSYSTKFTKKFCENFDFGAYRSQFTHSEIFSLYNRAFLGVNSGAMPVFQQKSESYSPFLDVDFFEFCLTIPLEKRLRHRIYDKWILARYPDAAKYSHNGQRRVGGAYFDSLRVRRTFNRAVKALSWRNRTDDSREVTSSTPIGYWYESNIALRSTLDNYFADNIHRLDDYPQLQTDCRDLYETGTAIEKTQVLTLLGVMKLYFR